MIPILWGVHTRTCRAETNITQSPQLLSRSGRYYTGPTTFSAMNTVLLLSWIPWDKVLFLSKIRTADIRIWFPFSQLKWVERILRFDILFPSKMKRTDHIIWIQRQRGDFIDLASPPRHHVILLFDDIHLRTKWPKAQIALFTATTVTLPCILLTSLLAQWGSSCYRIVVSGIWCILPLLMRREPIFTLIPVNRSISDVTCLSY